MSEPKQDDGKTYWSPIRRICPYCADTHSDLLHAVCKACRKEYGARQRALGKLSRDGKIDALPRERSFINPWSKPDPAEDPYTGAALPQD